MRVLHIMSGFGGGISSFILNQAKNFRNKNIIFDVITFDQVSNLFLNTIEETGGKVYRIPNPKTQGFRNYYKQVNQIMGNLPQDTFVHCHIRGYRAMPFSLIAKQNRLKRFGIHAHTTGLPEEIDTAKNKMIRTINNHISSHKLSCGVEASKYLFGERYIANKEIMHIPNSIHPEKFIEDLKVSKEQLLGYQNTDKFIIGHIGRFKSVKNHLFMLSVVELLAETTLDFKWVFAGDGDDFETIKKVAAEKELNEYVQFLGRRNDIPELLQVTDLFVLPSLYEGFPTVAVESQASSTKTLLSETITKEVDLELGLVDFLPIDNPGIWADHILNHLEPIEIPPSQRLQRLKEKKLTNKEAAKLYQEFLEQKITHYEMN